MLSGFKGFYPPDPAIITKETVIIRKSIIQTTAAASLQ
jgi:hypothetical protein